MPARRNSWRSVAKTGLVVALVSTSQAMAQTGEGVTPRGNVLAYQASIKCFVANGSASGERQDAGDTSNAARYERGARKAFDIAVKLGNALGYSGSRINQDLGLAQSRELPKLVADRAYNAQALNACERMGFTSPPAEALRY
jgi:hypothetical protein